MTLGLLIAGAFVVKWWFMLSEHKQSKLRSNRLDESFKRNKEESFDKNVSFIKDSFLSQLASGEKLGAFSLSEPQSGSDASNMNLSLIHI